MTTLRPPDLDGGDPVEPVAVARRYPPPRASIDPDQSRSWLARLLPLVAAHRVVFGGSVALALVAMLAQVAIPAVIREAIDRAVATESSPLWPFVVAVLVIGVGRALITFVFRYGLYRTAFQIETDLRVLIYDHLSRLSFSFYDRTQSGQLISRANSDIRSVQLFLVFAPMISMTALMFVVAVIFMLSIHPLLTLVAIAPLPGVYLLGKRLRDEVFPLSWITQSRLADVASLVDENINGVRVVRSFAAERSQLNRLADAAVGVRWAGIRTIDARARYNPIIENLPRVGTLGVLVYGGWLVIDGQITEGTLFAFATYVLMLQAPFRTLGLFLMLGQRARASAARIYEVLDTEPEIVDRPDAQHLPRSTGPIVFDDVTFAYPGRRPDDDEVLRHFTLRIEPGETVALVGRTGSGKSTVGRLLARFYDVTDGSVTIDGHDVRDVTQLSLRRSVGVVADDPFLFSASLADNIAYARPDADRRDVVAAATAAQAHEFIARLPDGYDEVVGERGYTLSGGQRQRVSLARGLLANPPILILDDATSAIDVHVEEKIHDALTQQLSGRTTIVIAQRLSTIALADRVALIEGGRVVATGDHHHLLATQPLYGEILANLSPSSTGSNGAADEASEPQPADGTDGR